MTKKKLTEREILAPSVMESKEWQRDKTYVLRRPTSINPETGEYTCSEVIYIQHDRCLFHPDYWFCSRREPINGVMEVEISREDRNEIKRV